MIFTIAFLSVGICSIAAQDIIVKRDGKTIEAKIIEVIDSPVTNSSRIRFKYFSDPEGPTYVTFLEDVSTINYENGTSLSMGIAKNQKYSAKQSRNQISVTHSTLANTKNSSRQSGESKGSRQSVSAPQFSEPTSNQDSAASITAANTKNSSRQSGESRESRQQVSTPQLGEPNLLQMALNKLPAVPISGKNLKFEFGGDVWIAKVNGQNFLAGACKYEKNISGYILSLTTTNVWSGAAEEVIDLLQNLGVPLGPAAKPLRTGAKLAAKLAKWLPLKGSSIVLEYNEDQPIALQLHKGK